MRKVTQCGYVAVLAISAFAVMTAGCAGTKRQARPLAEEKPAVRKFATREELLLRLEDEMARFANIRAKALVSLSKQDILVPEGITDNMRRLSGKDYNKRFLQADVNGALFVSRPGEDVLKIKFSGEIIGPQAGFVLLGQDQQFWVMMPNPEEGSEDKDVPKSVVYTGLESRRLVRSPEYISARPQDVAELILMDEVYAARDGRLICYMETWPDYYVLNFLEKEWREHITSKIWIERGNLTVALHQLFDASGRIVAEARFRKFAKFAGSRSDLKIQVPVEMDILWPIDYLIMSMSLSNVTVNDIDMPSTIFEPNFGDANVVEVPPGTRPGIELMTMPVEPGPSSGQK